MKEVARWYSERLAREVGVVRWGVFGTPILLFPTAGGDAEEVERFRLIECLGPLLAQGRVKVFSCDSVAGREWTKREKSPRHCSWLQNQFDGFVYHELLPAIRRDCRSEDIEVVTAGASLGAFNALATLCRHPDAFKAAVCMSGTYDLESFTGGEVSPDFYFSSPIHFLPQLREGEQLNLLRRRFILLATGEGRWEDPTHTWRMADVLGGRGIPNRVDPWGPAFDHDWPTWRAMLPRYLEELA